MISRLIAMFNRVPILVFTMHLFVISLLYLQSLDIIDHLSCHLYIYLDTRNQSHLVFLLATSDLVVLIAIVIILDDGHNPFTTANRPLMVAVHRHPPSMEPYCTRLSLLTDIFHRHILIEHLLMVIHRLNILSLLESLCLYLCQVYNHLCVTVLLHGSRWCPGVRGPLQLQTRLTQFCHHRQTFQVI